MMKPIVNKKYHLEKFPGKGGWTYARIPEVIQNKDNPFGWVKVKGTVDGIEVKHLRLMPMGNGNLFLPVKAELRKKLRKEAGDVIHVVLYPDDDPLEVPEEFLLCLKDDPDAFRFFNSLSDSEKNYYLTWIYSAKGEETKVKRLAKSIERLSNGLKLYDKQ